MFIIIFALLTLLTAFYVYRRMKLSLFSKAGIPGPSPNFLFGNLLELRRKLFHELLSEWATVYGRVFGFYEGCTPNFVISDPELLQEVMVKQFSGFHGRKLFPMQRNPDLEPKVSMFLARGKRWKRIRTTTNPAFSDSKMRRMFPLIGDSVAAFMQVIEADMADRDGPVQIAIQDRLQKMTMDIICKCAFGVDTNSQTNTRHPFIESLKRFLGGQNFSTLKAAVILTLPELRTPLIWFLEMLSQRPTDNSDIKTIRNKMIEVIELRKKSDIKPFDLLQLLLDAEITGSTLLPEEAGCPMGEGREDRDDKQKNAGQHSLTTDEVIAQATLFLFAGYETSSTAMTYILHFLAGNPEVQNKLQNEIDATFRSVNDTGMESLELFDAVSRQPYLNAVVHEVLRHRPFAGTVVHRVCMRKGGATLSNGIHVPEGAYVIPNSFALHFDPDIWQGIDPQKFAPERFLEVAEDGSYEFVGPPHPLAWIPFGAGPRNCVGQRFAMMAIKSGLSRFLHQYHTVSDKFAGPLKLRVGATIAPVDPVILSFLRRRGHDEDGI